jgi:hypothetical protein
MAQSLAHIDLHSKQSIAIRLAWFYNAGESYEAPVHHDLVVIARRVHVIEEAAFVAPRFGQLLEY